MSTAGNTVGDRSNSVVDPTNYPSVPCFVHHLAISPERARYQDKVDEPKR